MTKTNIVLSLVIVLMSHGLAMGQYAGGNGSVGDPYLISTDVQLKHLSATSGDWSEHFRLEDDIDMAAIVDFWPIGGTIAGPWAIPFTGTSECCCSDRLH